MGNMILPEQVGEDDVSTHRNSIVNIYSTVIARVAAIVLTAIPAITFAQSEVVLAPVKDTSLYEDSGGTIGNGAGQHLFAGRVGSNGGGLIRRAVLAFDVASSVPEGATITGAELILNLSRSPGGTVQVTVHALTADWGEGASDAAGEEGSGATAVANDATWLHTFFDTSTWQTPGGDFVEAESAKTDVSANLKPYSWSGDGLIADVQRWLDTPETNFGWIVIGDEQSQGNTRRFDSRENPSENTRPNLRLVFSTATSNSDDEIPSALELRGNFPNPFSGTTSIVYELSSPTVVTLDVFDLQGRRIATLVDGLQSAGIQRVGFDATDLAPGSYVYRLTGGDFSRASKMVVLP